MAMAYGVWESLKGMLNAVVQYSLTVYTAVCFARSQKALKSEVQVNIRLSLGEWEQEIARGLAWREGHCNGLTCKDLACVSLHW